jgi:ferrochelatase
MSDAALLITLGGPRTREEVEPFVRGILAGRPAPPGRVEEVLRHYEAIGGASPILAITERQAERLRDALAARGLPIPVYLGMRAWHPCVGETLARMADDGVRRAVALVLAPHRSEESDRRYREAVEAGLARLGPRAPAIRETAPWHDHPLFIEAVAARARDALETIPPPDRGAAAWIYTAHSIPSASPGAGAYQQDLWQTMALVDAALGHRGGTLAFQSRSGDPRQPWLGPDVSEAIRAESGRGASAALLIPIGFTADHVEVLYDLDVSARATAAEARLRFARAKTVGEHPAFIDMLARLVRQGLAANA